MRDFAKEFYTSQAWEKCRKAYSKSVGGLCEECMRKGIVRAGVIVHHKIHIEPENIDDPDITLDFKNLELLCRDCHGMCHGKKRYRINSDGTVSPK